MRNIHKYLGLFLFPIIFLLVCSGIVLNHRKQFSKFDVSRSILSDSYKYSNWNYGFFKNGLPLDSNRILLYGTEGVWISNRDSVISECNQGIDPNADQRKIHRIIRTSNNQIFAISSYHLYRFKMGEMQWAKVDLPESEDLFIDIESKADTLVILSRSNYYVGLVNDQQQKLSFTVHDLHPTTKYERQHSLFKFIWDLHSGSLWGITGRIVIDIIGLLFLFISFSGFMIWLYKKTIKRNKSNNRSLKDVRKRFAWYYKYHDKWGYWLLIPFMIITISGTFLRPPFLLFVANSSIAPIPGTNMESENKWKDLLRAIRYDKYNNSWLIYTSDGMYEFKNLWTSERISRLNTPPISVMGLNVMEQINEDEWIIGSFSGLYIWNKTFETYYDALNNNIEAQSYGLPFSNNQVSGLVFYNNEQTILFDYNNGASTIESKNGFIKMPDKYKTRPMSLWNLSLEIHTGRIVTFLGIMTLLIPCILGITIIIILISGWKISKLKCFIRSATSYIKKVYK